MSPALVFDLDGTLVDSLPGIAAALNRALHDHGQPTHPLTDVRRFIGSGAFMLCRRALASSESDHLAREIEATFKRHYAESWPEGTALYPGIHSLIRRLAERGDRLAVLSNKPDAFTREMVAHLFPDHPFELVRGQCDDTPRKPDAGAMRPLLAHWSISPAEVLLIGDSSIDRATAEAAGTRFLGVAWGYEDATLLGPDPASSVEDLASRLGLR